MCIRDRALAKQTAATALQALMDEAKPARTIEVLMRRAWLDAMTLTALRQGEASPAWQKQLETTRKILETVTAPEPVQSPELAKDIDTAMRQGGYHETEATALSLSLIDIQVCIRDSHAAAGRRDRHEGSRSHLAGYPVRAAYGRPPGTVLSLIHI